MNGLRVAPVVALLVIYGVGQLVEMHRRRSWESKAELAQRDVQRTADFAARQTAARLAILEQFPAVRHLHAVRDDRRA